MKNFLKVILNGMYIVIALVIVVYAVDMILSYFGFVLSLPPWGIFLFAVVFAMGVMEYRNSKKED